MRHVEKEYSCSGLCSALPFYLFTDVAKGPPDEACLEYITFDEFERKRDINGQVLFICGAFSFFGFFFQFGFCGRREDRVRVGYVKKS